MAGTTKDRHRSCPAEVCRENGWEVGTRIIGDEGYGPTIIEITALGDHKLLARRIAHDGVAVRGDEQTWVLYCRDWRAATEDEIPVPFTPGQRVRFLHDDEPIEGTIRNGPDSQGCYVIDVTNHVKKLWMASGRLLEAIAV